MKTSTKAVTSARWSALYTKGFYFVLACAITCFLIPADYHGGGGALFVMISIIAVSLRIFVELLRKGKLD